LSNREGFWQIRGQAQPFISLGDVRKTRVFLPPLYEQKRIVDLMSTVDSYIEALEEQINRSMSLRSGLLSDLLGGKHEIPATYDQLIGAA
jgi:type I restriction enzyme S subunit